jgi:hypothetical protein
MGQIPDRKDREVRADSLPASAGAHPELPQRFHESNDLRVHGRRGSIERKVVWARIRRRGNSTWRWSSQGGRPRERTCYSGSPQRVSRQARVDRPTLEAGSKRWIERAAFVGRNGETEGEDAEVRVAR